MLEPDGFRGMHASEVQAIWQNFADPRVPAHVIGVEPGGPITQILDAQVDYARNALVLTVEMQKLPPVRHVQVGAFLPKETHERHPERPV